MGNKRGKKSTVATSPRGRAASSALVSSHNRWTTSESNNQSQRAQKK